MKKIIMEQTIMLLFPPNKKGEIIVPEEYELKQTETDITYLIAEENESNKEK